MKKNTLSALVIFFLTLLIGVGLYFRMDSKNISGGKESVLVEAEEPEFATTETPDAAASQKPSAKEEAQKWYEESFASIQIEASQGDALAQRKLSEIYEDCFTYNMWGSEKFFASVQGILKIASADTPATMARLRHIYNTRCADVDAGEPIPLEAYKLWSKESASSGDLVSQIRQASRSGEKLKLNELSNLLESMRRHKDSAAAFEIGELLSKLDDSWPETETKIAFEGAYARFAWQIAACRSGLDCTRDSRVMTLACTNSAVCTFSNYEQALLNQAIPAGARDQLEKQIEIIHKHYLK